MAEPFDSATYLEDVSAIHQEQYMSEFTEETPGRFGSTTNKLFKPATGEVVGDGLTMQYEYARADGVRFGTDPLGAFASPKTFTPGTVKIRFNKQDTTANDFSTVSASVQVDDIDVREAGKGSIVDFCDRLYRQVMPAFDEHLAILRHAGRNAVIALVNGTPTANNSWYGGGSSSTASNTNGGRIYIDNGSIAAFRQGTQLDFVNSSGVVVAGNIFVTDVNSSDLSVGLIFVSNSTTITTGNVATMQSTGDLSLIADNYSICYSGEYNAGIYSIGAWFSRPTAGESFIGGKDRSTNLYRWMLTNSTREGSTNAVINKSMFNNQAIAMGFKQEDESTGLVAMTDPTLHQALRDLLGEDSFIQIPISDDRMKRFMNFGTTGLNYQHGQFGTIKIVSDPLCPSNIVRFIASDTWRSYFYGWKGLQPMKRAAGAHWYTLNEPTPNAGQGKIWKADWYGLMMDWCSKPWLNGAILNVTAS